MMSHCVWSSMVVQYGHSLGPNNWNTLHRKSAINLASKERQSKTKCMQEPQTNALYEACIWRKKRLASSVYYWTVSVAVSRIECSLGATSRASTNRRPRQWLALPIRPETAITKPMVRIGSNSSAICRSWR